MKHQGTDNTSANKEAARNVPLSPFAGRPLDGSQYLDVVEEQEYADRRPSAEEQRPRYSYMHNAKEGKD